LLVPSALQEYTVLLAQKRVFGEHALATQLPDTHAPP
jgi:hypothetical protein